MNIEDYEFTDGDIQAYSVGDESSVCFRLSHANAYMYKEDIIALAKHFKLTANDLNTD